MYGIYNNSSPVIFYDDLDQRGDEFLDLPIRGLKEKMQVKINHVDVEWTGAGAKRWGKAVVTYDSPNGSNRKQNVVSFKNPDVFKKVQESVGETLEVEVTKNDKGYDEWKSIAAPIAGPVTSVASAPTTRVSGSNYETKEERAARQVLIVKQSSLSNAVETLSVGAKTPPAKENVLELAQAYADWVFDTSDKTGFDSMSDDIPF